MAWIIILLQLIFFIEAFSQDYKSQLMIGELQTSFNPGLVLDVNSSDKLSKPCPPQSDSDRAINDLLYPPEKGWCYFSIDQNIFMTFSGSAWESKSMRWMGAWNSGEYYTNEVVLDDGWTMIANKNTSDRAAPQADGLPSWILPENLNWSQSMGNTIYLGYEIITNKPLEIKGLRVWVSENSSAHDIDVYIFDITNSSKGELLSNISIKPEFAVDKWTEVSFPSKLFLKDSKLRIVLRIINHGSADSWSFNWLYDGIGVDGPGDNNYRRDLNHNFLYVSEIDIDGFNRTQNLAQLKQGDQIRLIEESSTRFDLYEVIDSIDSGDYFTIEVLRLDNGSEIRAGKQVSINSEIKSNILPSSYVHFDDYFLQEIPDIQVKGFFQETYDPENIVLNDNAYGIDFKGSYYTKSDDWDILGYLGSSSIGGTSGGNVSGPENSTDSAIVLFDGNSGKLIKDSPFLNLNGSELIVGDSSSRGSISLESGNINDAVTLIAPPNIDGGSYTLALPKTMNIDSNYIGRFIGTDVNGQMFFSELRDYFGDLEIPKSISVSAKAGVRGKIRIYDTDLTNYVDIWPTSNIENSYDIILPESGSPGNNYILESNQWGDLSWIPTPKGDVLGPASSLDNNIVSFDGLSGKIIKDSGLPVTQITDNTTNITSNTNRITQNESDILQNASDIATNTTNITNNTNDIATNITNISNNTDAINQNAGDIATNTTNISNNTNAINQNSNDIATNTTSINNNTNAIATNTTNINNNTNAISNNTTNITTNASRISQNETDIGNKITGPATATNNALVIFDGTTGKLAKESSNLTYIGTSLNLGGGTAKVRLEGITQSAAESAEIELVQSQTNRGLLISYKNPNNDLLWAAGVSYNVGSFASNYSISRTNRERTSPDFVMHYNDGGIVLGNWQKQTSAKLQIDSTTQGFLPPRMTTTQRDAIATPATGLIIYNTTANKHQGYNGSTWNDFY